VIAGALFIAESRCERLETAHPKRPACRFRVRAPDAPLGLALLLCATGLADARPVANERVRYFESLLSHMSQPSVKAVAKLPAVTERNSWTRS
jgi:hypothetical protein